MQQMNVRSLAAGEICCKAGEEARSFFLVLEGVLEVSRSSRFGKTVVVNRISQGDIIGEIGALTRGPRSADVRCYTNCLVGEMPLKTFEENLAALPGFSMYVMRSMAYRVANLTNKLLEFATEDVPSRVLGALRELPCAVGMEPEYSQPARERPTHAELAKLVGTSREVVGRALQLLESAGEIEQDGRYVYLKQVN